MCMALFQGFGELREKMAREERWICLLYIVSEMIVDYKEKCPIKK